MSYSTPGEKIGHVETKASDVASPMATDKHYHFGLTKREYFAAQIAAGLHANPAFGDGRTNQAIAEMAVDAADELIKALKK